MKGYPKPSAEESREEILGPHRREERRAVTTGFAARLRARGVHLAGTETSEEVGDLLDAVERFEYAVEACGGDLMVDQGPQGRTTEPDDPRFVIPQRAAREQTSAYIDRINEAADRLRGSGGRAD